MDVLKFFGINLFVFSLVCTKLLDVIRLLIYFLLLSVSFDFVCCSCFCQHTADCKELRYGEKFCI